MAEQVKHAGAMSPADPSAITHYHAHIYYDPGSTRARAERLREQVRVAFPQAVLGR
jgi:aromatic ring-cleaving dioxygenase